MNTIPQIKVEFVVNHNQWDDEIKTKIKRYIINKGYLCNVYPAYGLEKPYYVILIDEKIWYCSNSASEPYYSLVIEQCCTIKEIKDLLYLVLPSVFRDIKKISNEVLLLIESEKILDKTKENTE